MTLPNPLPSSSGLISSTSYLSRTFISYPSCKGLPEYTLSLDPSSAHKLTHWLSLLSRGYWQDRVITIPIFLPLSSSKHASKVVKSLRFMDRSRHHYILLVALTQAWFRLSAKFILTMGGLRNQDSAPRQFTNPSFPQHLLCFSSPCKQIEVQLMNQL